MKKIIFLFLISLSFIYPNSEDCYKKIFNIRSETDARIIDFVEQISELCNFNLIIDQSLIDRTLNKKLSRVYLKKKRLGEVLDFFLSENNIFYDLSNDILRLSYIQTKTYHIDYIASNRIGETSTEVSVGGNKKGNQDVGNIGSVGTKISTQTKFENFWKDLKRNIYLILNRPEDKYIASEPVINEKAGLITVSGTYRQLKRVKEYIDTLNEKLKRQVLIDVNILSVSLNQENSTGIDWSDFYSGISNGGTTPIRDASPGLVTTVSMNQIIQFLKKYGSVKSISNPKIVASNNQPALISIGNEYFYSIKETQIKDTSSGNSNTLNSTKIESVFAGILLDITADISNDGKVTLSINPSISQTAKTLTQNSNRSIPPDLTKKQLSSVITTESGKKVILGGLITKSKTVENTQVPLLGYMPVVGSLFRSQKSFYKNEELIIIITPYILDNGLNGEILEDYQLIELHE